MNQQQPRTNILLQIGVQVQILKEEGCFVKNFKPEKKYLVILLLITILSEFKTPTQSVSAE